MQSAIPESYEGLLQLYKAERHDHQVLQQELKSVNEALSQQREKAQQQQAQLAKLVPELRKFVATAAENKKLKGRLTELKAGLRIAQEQAASASQTHQAAAQELQGVLAAQQEAERRCAAAERSCSEVEGQAAALKSERQEARQQCAAAEQDVSRLREQLAATLRERDEMAAEVRSLRAAVEEIRSQLQHHEQLLRQREQLPPPGAQPAAAEVSEAPLPSGSSGGDEAALQREQQEVRLQQLRQAQAQLQEQQQRLQQAQAAQQALAEQLQQELATVLQRQQHAVQAQQQQQQRQQTDAAGTSPQQPAALDSHLALEQVLAPLRRQLGEHSQQLGQAREGLLALTCRVEQVEGSVSEVAQSVAHMEPQVTQLRQQGEADSQLIAHWRALFGSLALPQHEGAQPGVAGGQAPAHAATPAPAGALSAPAAAPQHGAPQLDGAPAAVARDSNALGSTAFMCSSGSSGMWEQPQPHAGSSQRLARTMQRFASASAARTAAAIAVPIAAGAAADVAVAPYREDSPTPSSPQAEATPLAKRRRVEALLPPQAQQQQQQHSGAGGNAARAPPPAKASGGVQQAPAPVRSRAPNQPVDQAWVAAQLKPLMALQPPQEQVLELAAARLHTALKGGKLSRADALAGLAAALEGAPADAAPALARCAVRLQQLQQHALPAGTAPRWVGDVRDALAARLLAARAQGSDSNHEEQQEGLADGGATIAVAVAQLCRAEQDSQALATFLVGALLASVRRQLLLPPGTLPPPHQNQSQVAAGLVAALPLVAAAARCWPEGCHWSAGSVNLMGSDEHATQWQLLGSDPLGAMLHMVLHDLCSQCSGAGSGGGSGSAAAAAVVSLAAAELRLLGKEHWEWGAISESLLEGQASACAAMLPVLLAVMAMHLSLAPAGAGEAAAGEGGAPLAGGEGGAFAEVHAQRLAQLCSAVELAAPQLGWRAAHEQVLVRVLHWLQPQPAAAAAAGCDHPASMRVLVELAGRLAAFVAADGGASGAPASYMAAGEVAARLLQRLQLAQAGGGGDTSTDGETPPPWRAPELREAAFTAAARILAALHALSSCSSQGGEAVAGTVAALAEQMATAMRSGGGVPEPITALQLLPARVASLVEASSQCSK